MIDFLYYLVVCSAMLKLFKLLLLHLLLCLAIISVCSFSVCVLSEPREKLLLIGTRPYSAMLDACTVIVVFMKPPKNNFELTVGRWKKIFYKMFHDLL